MHGSSAFEPASGVVVLGVFRSGTSVTCAMLEKLGVWFGPHATMLGPEPQNPLGYFQHRPVREVNARFMRSAGSSEARPASPEGLVARGDLDLLRGLDLDWRNRRRMWGLKDPRLCSSLLAFIEAGVIDRHGLRIVHVTRDIAACTASASAFHVMRDLVDGSGTSLGDMLSAYDAHARWHVRNLGVPTLELSYERLVSSPAEVAAELANFVGNERKRDIGRAKRLVGARRALRHYRVRQALRSVPPLLFMVRTARRLMGRADTG